MNDIRVIVAVLLAIGMIVGLVSRGSFFKRLLLMLAVAVFGSFLWAWASQWWNGFSPFMRWLVLAGVIVGWIVLLLVGTKFGREVLASMIGDFLYDALKALVTFPGRLLRFFRGLG